MLALGGALTAAPFLFGKEEEEAENYYYTTRRDDELNISISSIVIINDNTYH